MPRRIATPPTPPTTTVATPAKPKRVRRTQDDIAFSGALKTAHRRLSAAIDERALCNERLSRLSVEIPSLERTIQALTVQMNPNVAPSMARDNTNFIQGNPADLSTYKAQPKDVPAGAGSIPAYRPDGSALPVSDEVPDLDTLPGMSGGNWA